MRIPKKNIALFHGKPMLQRAIETAKACGLFDEIVVSTDDNDIASEAYRHTVAVSRRKTDDGSRGTQEVAADVLRAWTWQEFNAACVLYPCTPLLTWRELVKGFRWLLTQTPMNHTYAYSMHRDGTDAGGFYWGLVAAFLAGVPLEGNSMRVVVSEHFDINTPEDWDRASERFIELQGAT